MSGEIGQVSVVIPTHNRATLVMRAVESCLSQGSACGEVIVVDDHSTDDTRDVVAAIDDPRVRLLASPSRGAPAARNVGYRSSANELIKFLDDDDFLVPDALSRQLLDVSSIDPEDRSGVVVYGDALFLRGDGGSPFRVSNPRRRRNESELEYLYRHNVLTACPLHRKALLDRVGGFDERLVKRQEKDLHFRLAAHGARFVHRPTDVYVYDFSETRARITTSLQGREDLVIRLAEIHKYAQIFAERFPGGIPRRVSNSLIDDYTSCRSRAAALGDSELERQAADRAQALTDRGPLAHGFATSRGVQRIKRSWRRFVRRHGLR